MKYVIPALILGFALGFAVNEVTLTQKTEVTYDVFRYSLPIEQEKCEKQGGTFDIDVKDRPNMWKKQYVPKCTKEIK